jgi:hypothetical protein
MTTRQRFKLGNENLTARRVSAGAEDPFLVRAASARRSGLEATDRTDGERRFRDGDPPPRRRVRQRLVLAGIAAAVLPGCMLIGNLSQFDGAVEAHDASTDSAADHTSTPRDGASDDVNAGGDGTTSDGTMGDGTTDDGSADVADADAASAPVDPALPPDASTVTCPTTINGVIDADSPTQVGRHSRNSTSIPSVCGTRQSNPGNGADMTGAHFYAVYRFSNPTSAAVCFNFTLTYDGAVAVVDAGPDASGDDASDDAGIDAGTNDAATDGGPVTVPAGLQKYMVAYSTFYPTDIVSSDYLADVGDLLQPPQTMGVTVPAGGTIDVVIEAVAPAPDGTDTFTLTCATQ